MDLLLNPPDACRPLRSATLSPKAAILLAICCGLAGGYLDLAIIFFKKVFGDGQRHYGNGVDFPWIVPLGHVLLLLIPGLLLALVCWLRPRPLSMHAGCWFFATLALSSALLRMPFYGPSSLLLAAGAGLQISRRAAAVVQHPQLVRRTLLSLLSLLSILAAHSSGWRAVRDYCATATLPRPPSNARNVVLIVWDTVRAANLSVYGYPRNTTPNLAKWARKGVRYNLAIAPAPWTYPSHTSFFTGYWPFQLISQRKFTLDAPMPTLAEHLASRGYLTAGFAANTKVLTYETKLDRGFTHFEDFPLTLRSFLSRTVAGSWILEYILYRNDWYESKWIRLQSRNASAINGSFFNWLRYRKKGRPFFAYLNYFDAHDPYMPPNAYAGRFGIRPNSPEDYRFLLEYSTPGWRSMQERDILMAHDCYDDCIAYLDDHVGQFLDELEDQGLLDSTLVIITADHGESFGDHRSFLHGNGLYLEETGVPLVILGPSAPADRIVADPVSLRDLPATVMDQLGLSAGSPFPGRSLAAHWKMAPGEKPQESSPAFSEFTTLTAFRPKVLRNLGQTGIQMSLVSAGKHYMRDGFGFEELYDLSKDSLEIVNLIDSEECTQYVQNFRKMLLEELNNHRASSEVGTAYLRNYRQRLQSLVPGNH